MIKWIWKEYFTDLFLVIVFVVFTGICVAWAATEPSSWVAGLAGGVAALCLIEITSVVYEVKSNPVRPSPDLSLLKKVSPVMYEVYSADGDSSIVAASFWTVKRARNWASSENEEMMYLGYSNPYRIRRINRVWNLVSRLYRGSSYAPQAGVQRPSGRREQAPGDVRSVEPHPDRRGL